MYAGLAILFFFLVIFLQQVARLHARCEAGLTTLPVTRDHVRCSRAASARSPTATGRGCSWARGPLLAAAGILLFLR